MKGKVFALLLAASLVSASVSPVAADDFTIEMQSQDIAFDEPEFAEETPVVEDVAEFEEEDASNEEDGAAGFDGHDTYDGDFSDEEQADDIVVEDSYDEDFADDAEALAETQDSFILDEESAVETVNLAEGIPIDEAHFPDPVFRDYIKGKFDDGDGYLSENERNRVWSLEVQHKGISSLAGIEYFGNLESLNCFNNQLTSLDVSKCTELHQLYCDANQLTSLNVSGCTALDGLICSFNQLTSLDLSKCTALYQLYCDNNQLSSLDVSKCTALGDLMCRNNQLTYLDVSKCTELRSLDFVENQITILDISGCTALENLCGFENKLTSLDVSKCPALKFINCSDNQLTSLDVSKNLALKTLECDDNQLTNLDVSRCTLLEALYCSGNQLTSLDVSKVTALQALVCSGNQFNTIDISEQSLLVDAYLYGKKVEYADFIRFTSSYTVKDLYHPYLCIGKTTKIITYPEHDHIPQVSVPGIPATCTKDGKTAEEKCSVCGEILTAQEPIPALGHNWGNWTTKKAATTTAEGKETRTCSRCGAKETRSVPKLPKKANPITVKSKSPSVSKTAKKAQTIKASDAFTIKNAQGTVTFKKKSGSSGKLSINSKTGLITVKKGTEKGTYKIVVAVTAAGNKQYKAGTKTVTVKVKVK